MFLLIELVVYLLITIHLVGASSLLKTAANIDSFSFRPIQPTSRWNQKIIWILCLVVTGLCILLFIRNLDYCRCFVFLFCQIVLQECSGQIYWYWTILFWHTFLISYQYKTVIFGEFSAVWVESDVAPIQLKAFIDVLVFSFVPLEHYLSTI